eukprot:1161158-Pelagomonas_calceolata.AAC.5
MRAPGPARAPARPRTAPAPRIRSLASALPPQTMQGGTLHPRPPQVLRPCPNRPPQQPHLRFHLR